MTAVHATSPAALLQLMWLASPALPVGGFSYSEGLEAAVDAGIVTNEATASAWLTDQLWLSLARCDMPVMSKAFEAWKHCGPSEPTTTQPTTQPTTTDQSAVSPTDGPMMTIVALNQWTLMTRETSELRLQTEQMGRSMALWMKNRHAEAGAPDPRLDTLARLEPAPTWPVSFALAAAQTGAPLKDAMLAFAFGWAENMVQSAIKSVPLGQLSGQRILEALTRDIPAAVDHAMTLPDAQRQAFTPMLAVLSARHETQYSRLFRS